MIRLTRLADYAVLLMTHLAREQALRPDRVHNAGNLARETHIPAPTVSKLLGVLSRGDLLASHRGHNGGYSLSKSPGSITTAEIISVVDGPIALTDCIEDAPGECGIESLCGVRGAWQKINDAIRLALDEISLAELCDAQVNIFDRMPSVDRPNADIH